METKSKKLNVPALQNWLRAQSELPEDVQMMFIQTTTVGTLMTVFLGFLVHPATNTSVKFVCSCNWIVREGAIQLSLIVPISWHHHWGQQNGRSSLTIFFSLENLPADMFAN